jgi:hypothetical protein
MLKRILIFTATLLFICGMTDLHAYQVKYQYDQQKRLVAAEYVNIGKIIYTYDAIGNRLSQTVTVFRLLKGDLNQDDAVNLTDAILALQIQAGLKPAVYLAGDANGDGRIDIVEAIYILQTVAAVR